MEDLGESKFRLLNDSIMEAKLPLESAGGIGRKLAELAKFSRTGLQLATIEPAVDSWNERSFELRMICPNNPERYKDLEKEFLSNDNSLLWPDGHPKNIFINPQSEVAFIDFGRCHKADHRFMLPNFLAHIVIYGLAGYIDEITVKEYVKLTVNGYREIEPVDEQIYCQYLAMEVLHRAFGKWIQGIDKSEQKIKIVKFGLKIFDEHISSIYNLF
jgi:hypothetical protein